MNRKKRGPPFVMLEKSTLHGQEWKGLSTPEMVTYIYIKEGYNGSNNGEIPFTYSRLKGVLAPATISKSLKSLINKGWVEKTRHGGLYRFYCLYKLTGKHDQIR